MEFQGTGDLPLVYFKADNAVAGEVVPNLRSVRYRPSGVTGRFRQALQAVDECPDEQGDAQRQGGLDDGFDAVHRPAAAAQLGEDVGGELLLGGHGELLSSFSFASRDSEYPALRIAFFRSSQAKWISAACNAACASSILPWDVP